MIERATVADAKRINGIINHETVRPFIAFDDTPEFDLAPVLDNPNNIILTSQNGGFCLVPKNAELTAYELHTFYMPEGHGREVHDAAREMFAWMFTKTPARYVYTLVPDDCPHARPPVSFGWRPYFSRHNLFVRGGVRIGAQYWRLDLWDWAAKQKALVGLMAVLGEIKKAQPAKAQALALEWLEWSGEDLTCH